MQVVFFVFVFLIIIIIEFVAVVMPKITLEFIKCVAEVDKVK
jgi:hypothetical protein